MADRRLDRIWTLEIDPTSWRSASGTSRAPVVPAVRAPGRGARGPYAGTSPRSSWARPAALLGPGGPLRVVVVLQGELGQVLRSSFESSRTRTSPRAGWGAGVQEPVRGPQGVGQGEASQGGATARPLAMAGTRRRPRHLNSTAESIAGRRPAPPGPREGARGHRQASANGRPPSRRRPPAGASRLPRPPRPGRSGRGRRPPASYPRPGNPSGPSREPPGSPGGSRGRGPGVG